MKNSAFLNFLFLLVFKHRAKHVAIFLISVVIVWLLASVMFINASIKKDALLVLKTQPDFVVQKLVGGKTGPIKLELIDKISELKGVNSTVARVYGRYFLPDNKHYFSIVGVDFFDEILNKNLKKLSDKLDIKEFLQKPNMIVGDGVKAYMKKRYYEKDFNFRLPNGEMKKVYIYDTLPKSSNLVGNDMIILDIENAKEILGIDDDKATDIVLDVPNDAERENIKLKLLSLNFDTRVISKDELKEEYENFFNYKSGLFLLLFIIVFVTFMLILYQRYSMINSSDKKEIAILRSVGWSIKDVLKLKVSETLIVGLFAFVLGILLAYIYVFILNAPLLRNIFLGFNNLENSVTFTPIFDFGLLSSLFLFFIVPFIASVLIPVWKIAITDPNEAMK
jgi:ABC-type lipoprotein release transport system permease subunit